MAHYIVLLALLAVSLTTSGTFAKDGFEERLVDLLRKEFLDKEETLDKRQGKPSSCTEEYAQLPASTMCVFEDSPSASNKGVSSADKDLIVKLHNEFRSKVQPGGAQMQKMYWDDKIAAIAQKYANACPGGKHDTHENRNVPGYGIRIGQNLARGYVDWTGAVNAWHDEVEVYRYGVEAKTYLKQGQQVGHYTQIVRDLSARIGCGFAKCAGNENFVCNYVFGNLYSANPYVNGTTCSKCPKTCKDNLCDCNGKVCFNGGLMDPNTCTCKCSALYSGSSCETLNCPTADKSTCGKAWPKGFPNQDYCLFTNVPPECPYMCGICGKKAGWNGESKAAGGDASTGYKCPHNDIRCCKNWKVEYCTKYSNVPEDCPMMCGRCNAKCPGKGLDYCKNGGTVDMDTCKCKCADKYRGERCTKWMAESCPVVDGSNCGLYYKAKDCKYGNVPPMCPVMCGLCEAKCPGKDNTYCKNRSTLKEGSCTCECAKGWSGERCDVLDACPSKDYFQCGSTFKASMCPLSSQITQLCPYMCGLC